MSEHLLHKAVKEGSLSKVAQLIEQGKNVNDFSVSGVTPLHLAARNGRLDIIRLLIKNGADVHVKSSRGRTASDWAEAAGQSAAKSVIEHNEL